MEGLLSPSLNITYIVRGIGHHHGGAFRFDRDRGRTMECHSWCSMVHGRFVGGGAHCVAKQRVSLLNIHWSIVLGWSTVYLARRTLR